MNGHPVAVRDREHDSFGPRQQRNAQSQAKELRAGQGRVQEDRHQAVAVAYGIRHGGPGNCLKIGAGFQDEGLGRVEPGERQAAGQSAGELQRGRRHPRLGRVGQPHPGPRSGVRVRPAPGVGIGRRPAANAGAGGDLRAVRAQAGRESDAGRVNRVVRRRNQHGCQAHRHGQTGRGVAGGAGPAAEIPGNNGGHRADQQRRRVVDELRINLRIQARIKSGDAVAGCARGNDGHRRARGQLPRGVTGSVTDP